MDIKTILGSGRFYFYPIITANMLAMTLAVGGNVRTAVLYSFVISFLSSFGFLLNDLWDRDVDLVNRAGHFENSESKTIFTGIVICILFFIAGLGLAALIGMNEFILALVIAVGLFFYTVLFRRFLLIPTIVAATLASSPLWTPLLLWSDNSQKLKLIFVLSIIIMIAGREIFMDTRDIAGDFKGGRDTFATVFGTGIAKFVALILTISACIPFGLSIFYRTADLSLIENILVITVGGLIFYLLVIPASATIRATAGERPAIQNYVLKSRIAMAFIPVLTLLLWYIKF